MAWLVILWLVEGGFRAVVAPAALAFSGWVSDGLASITRLEWIVIIAGWLIWRELVFLRKLITAFVARTASDGNEI